MQIDRRILNGLAWAGVALVVGVPLADYVSGKFGDEAPQVAVIEPAAPAPVTPPPAATETAVVAPAKPAADPVSKPQAQTADVVDKFVQGGRPLPSYISGGDAPAAPAQTATTPTRPVITTTPAPVVIDPVQVAAIPKVAPIPMPLSMRPMPVAVVPPSAVVVPQQQAVVVPGGNVTAEDLEDWESGPLSEFLAARERQTSSDYQQGGFFLDEAPTRPRQRDRVIGPSNESFYPFLN